MTITGVLFLLVILHGNVIVGEERVKYLVNLDYTTCVMEMDASIQTQFNKCIEKKEGSELLFDYDFSEATIYYVTSGGRHIEGAPLYGGNLDIHRTWIFQQSSDMVDLTLDWFHYTLYVIDRGGKRLSRYQRHGPQTSWKNNKRLGVLWTFYDPKVIGQSAGIIEEDLYFKKVHVDPYNKIIFIQLIIKNNSNEDNSTTAILRTDLEGKNARLATETRFTKGMVFYIDVGELKMYILDGNRLRFYDYEGRELRPAIHAPKDVEYMYVFRNMMYLSVYDEADRKSFIMRYELTLLPQDIPSAIYAPLKIRGAKIRFKLFDVRTRRRIVNGTYICDRTDCPDSCVVTPTGDECYCKRRGETRDGLSCYDCGQSNLTNVPAHLLIVGGQDATRSDFPWHSVIYELKDNTWQQTCGGTLISPSVVLTAAHCVTEVRLVPKLKEAASIMVAFGKIYRNWNANEPSEIKMHVKEILAHENFMGGAVNFGYDIALLYLESKVKYSWFVMPACLDFNNNQMPSTQTVTGYVPGFGFTGECGSLCSNQSDELRYTKIEKVSTFFDCFNESQSIDHSNFVMLTPDKFCIGNGSASAVQKGDSGGGLTLTYRGLHYVSGVVSIKFVKLSRKPEGSPYSYSFGAFTNVSFHMDWLKKNLPEGE